MITGLGLDEIIVILMIALFVVGPADLTRLARWLGKVMRQATLYRDELSKAWAREEAWTQMHQVLQQAAADNMKVLQDWLSVKYYSVGIAKK